jgi:integrase
LWDRQNGLIVPTWDQACIAWLSDNPAKAEQEIYRYFLKWWKPHLSGKRLDSISPKMIHSIVIKHRKGVSLEERVKQNATANTYVGFVGRIIRHCTNLRPRFQVYPPNRGYERWLSPEQWLEITKHLSDDEKDILTFTLATGQREANMMFFEWGWGMKDSALIPSSDTKTGKPYGIPLNLTAQAVLEKRSQNPVKHLRYVFTDNGQEWHRLKLLRALGRACKAAGVPYITVHGLRHTFGTWLARLGVPRDIRMRLMGHTSKDTHDIYIHHDVESLRPYTMLLDAHFHAKPGESKATA